MSDNQIQALHDSKRPISALVITAVFSSMFLICMFAGWEIWTSRNERTESAAIATANMARGLALHTETTFKVAELVLTDIVERAEHEGMGGEQQQRLRVHLETLLGKARELHGLFIYDKHGEWVATSLRRVVKANNSDREYFQFHRAHQERAIHIGAPIRSRSSGIWIIPVSRRLNYPDGSFAGVALVTLRLDFFEAAYGKLNVGESGTILLALTNGTLYYRRPFLENNIGRDIKSGPLMETYRRNGNVGTAMLTAKIDNVERLYSYRKIDGFPLIVAVALSSGEIYNTWKKNSIQLGIGLLFLNAILFWIGKKLLRQLSIREQLESQLESLSIGLAKANLELSNLALKDGLTEIANRRAFDTALSQEYIRAKREQQPLSLLMLDVDHFKKFNDHYGHPAGDACLQQIATALSRATSRPADLGARYGGEEFAVLLPATTPSGAMKVAEKIKQAVMDAKIVHAMSTSGQVTVSIGVATIFPRSLLSKAPEDLLGAADAALYKAKHCGRNQLAFSLVSEIEEPEAV